MVKMKCFYVSDKLFCLFYFCRMVMPQLSFFLKGQEAALPRLWLQSLVGLLDTWNFLWLMFSAVVMLFYSSSDRKGCWSGRKLAKSVIMEKNTIAWFPRPNKEGQYMPLALCFFLSHCVTNCITLPFFLSGK